MFGDDWEYCMVFSFNLEKKIKILQNNPDSNELSVNVDQTKLWYSKREITIAKCATFLLKSPARNCKPFCLSRCTISQLGSSSEGSRLFYWQGETRLWCHFHLQQEQTWIIGYAFTFRVFGLDHSLVSFSYLGQRYIDIPERFMFSFMKWLYLSSNTLDSTVRVQTRKSCLYPSQILP